MLLHNDIRLIFPPVLHYYTTLLYFYKRPAARKVVDLSNVKTFKSIYNSIRPMNTTGRGHMTIFSPLCYISPLPLTNTMETHRRSLTQSGPTIARGYVSQCIVGHTPQTVRPPNKINFSEPNDNNTMRTI